MGTPTTPSGHRQPRGASEPLYSQMVRLYLRLFITLQGFFFFLSLFILFFPGTNKLFNAMALIISRCQCAGATLAVLGKPQPFSVGCAAPPFSGDVSFFIIMHPAEDSRSLGAAQNPELCRLRGIPTGSPSSENVALV